MESTDYPYLDLNDKLHNFVIQNNEETFGLQYQNGLNVEPIFAEVDCGDGTWTQYELPILMNGSLISEQPTSPLLNQEENLGIYDNNESNHDELLIDNTSTLTYPIEVPANSLMTPDGLFVTNDILLQLNQSADSVGTQKDSNEYLTNINQETIKNIFKNNTNDVIINHDDNSENAKINLSGTTNSNEIIHLLNVDGPLLNISSERVNNTKLIKKDMSKTKNGKHLLNLDEYFKTVLVHKCIKCNYLCEERSEILKHISDMHLSTVEKSNNNAKIKKIAGNNSSVLISNQNKATSNSVVNGVKMKSILSSNNNSNTNDNCKTVFLCSECSLAFNTIENLKNHMITKHKLITLNNVEVQVDLAEDKVTSTPEADKAQKAKNCKNFKIIKKQNTCKKIKCSIKGCDARFSKDEYRLRHENCHVDGNKSKFKCTVCEKNFTIWRVCSLHLWKCHNIDSGLLTCPMCFSYKTMAPYKLLSHMQIHGNTNSFLCNICGKSFKQSSQLRNHYLIHNTDDLPPWAGQQKCDICGNFFANSKCLKKHIQSVHNKFKPFICNICGHKTARKAMLDLHLRQHTGEKPHKCTKCEYRTGDHNSFRRHMMRHSGAIKYSCSHCEYQSIQSTAYKNHLANKHPGLGGLYTCLLCTYNTVSEAAYNSHVKVHESKINNEDISLKNISVSTSLGRENTMMNLEPLEEILNGDDEETQNCFLSSDHAEDTVDTGGITIPAGLELQV